MSIMESLDKFLIAEIAADHGKRSLVPDEDLLERGILDSLGVMKLIVFIEKTFGIRVNDEEVVPENFQTINIIAKFIEQKMQDK
jgi:acyl carrier protein